ncbi:FtsW/RodA/SpoVE family cell cycle protein [Liquorilactobacillus hordei]|uniref:Probable peptidoglycan glycosyltransferase FtsW n=1 Tax=Liquorilactobacillus hordei DSM 19519 TaxID=1423759 RepID=A0A0R1MIB9_9LACO|nr:FtsW/RodA/SpoVE family cell cycle protein [Liquorilactobacillus hordei]KRL07670.1 cell division protein [Liquorilactobacillus hordei DSM 19519]QYH52634.1 FtsW/RodA/SpoVE family cell cycle protein [Liquorilactobacillus hordei DSM 19519]
MRKFRDKMRYFDFYLFVPYIVLCCIGAVMVYSASSINLSYAGASTNTYLMKQLIYVVMGLGCIFFSIMIPTKKLAHRNFIMIGFFALVILLLYAKFFTTAVNGANGWINLKLFSFQPAELCKLYLVLFMAQLVSNREYSVSTLNIKPSRKPAVLVVILLCLVLIEPDLGGFSINAFIVLLMYFASGRDYRKSLLYLSGILGSIIVVVQLLRFWDPAPLKGTKIEYMYARLTAFYNPFKVSSTSGQQLINSYYAISNGGLFGVGLGNSVQKRGYLPEPYTDFIIAIISEELGAIGVMVVLLLITWIILRIFLIGIRANSSYETMICYGIGTFMGVETLFNIGAVNGLLPITGVTFPFVSYGGSSMIVLSLALGIVINISINQKKNRK